MFEGFARPISSVKISIVRAETAAENIGYVDSWGLAISPEQQAIE
jgi:hypothetical protein